MARMNPVLRKDVLGLLRFRRAGAIQLLFIALLGLLVLATWPQQGVVSLASRGQDALLLGLIAGQLVLLVLFVPGVAATSITAEREQGTLEMLYASRLSAWQLIVGKLLSAVAYPLLLLVSGLPFIALLNYRGAVDVVVLGWACLVLLVTAVLLAVLSLAISALCRHSSTAMVISYVCALVICGGVLVPAAIMLASQGGTSAQLLHGLRSISPMAAALSLLRPHLAELGGRPGGFDAATGQTIAALPPAWQIFFPSAAAFIAISLSILILVLRRPPGGGERVGAAGGPVKKQSIARRILFLIDPKRQRKPFSRLNPLLSKESRTNQLRSGRWMIRIFYGALFVSMGLALMAVYGGQTEHADLLRYVAAVLVAFQICMIALIDPSLTSPSISAELETETFEMLRLTPLTIGRIFWGKLIPAIVPAMLPIVALLPAYAAVCFVNAVYIRSILLLLPVLVLTVALCCTTGLACSSTSGNTSRATVCNYLVIGAIVVLPLLAWLAAGTYLDPRVASWLAMPSPLVIGLSLLPDGSLEIARLWQAHLLVIGGLSLLMLLLAWMRLSVLLKRG